MPAVPTFLSAYLNEMVPSPGAGRRMAVLTLAQSVGTGLFLASSAIFVTTVIGLPPSQFALALSVAGLCGFLCSVPAGRLADRFGARIPLAISYAALAVLFVAYGFVDTLPEFAVVACGIAICETAGSPLRAALIFALFGGADATRVRAQNRSLFNLGFVGGAMLAALALAAGTRTAFLVVVCANAALQLTCAVLATRLRPAQESTGTGKGRRSWRALTDRRFLAATLLSGVLEMFQPILTVGLPLWVAKRVDAPHATVAVLLALNTALVVLFQVRMSRGSDTVGGSARLLLRAGILLALACVLFTLSRGVPPVLAVALLASGMAALTVGELAQAAGSWGLSFALPPADRIGEYQGVFALGRGLQQFFGPALITALVLGTTGGLGWLVLGAVFVAAGLAARWLFRPEAPDHLVATTASTSQQ